MRRLRDYTLQEWAVADPLRHAVRRVRNVAILRSYLRRRAEGQEALIAALRPAASGRTVVFTVAFNSARTIGWLADGFRAHGGDAVLVVCDNSPGDAARQAIAEACRRRAVACLPLPPPPLRRHILTNPPLSHGVALTWIFHNLVRPLAPRVFAFVDHDLIPLAPFDLAASLGDRPVYGDRSDRDAFGTWSLWAGYSVFSFAATGTLPLDFTADASLKLDTGGQNWSRLYRHIARDGLRFAERGSARVKLPGRPDPVTAELIDGWLHIGGVSYRGDAAERLAVAERVLAELAGRARDAAARPAAGSRQPA